MGIRTMHATLRFTPFGAKFYTYPEGHYLTALATAFPAIPSSGGAAVEKGQQATYHLPPSGVRKLDGMRGTPLLSTEGGNGPVGLAVPSKMVMQ